MSLLMDALKRAEEAKRNNAPAGAAVPRTAPTMPDLELELEPEPTSPLPELSAHQSSVDADLRATANHQERTQPVRKAATPQTTAAASNGGDEQAAARNMFDAKADGAPEKPNMVRVAAIIGVGCIAGLAIGGYFYYQYQAISGMGSGLAARPGVRPAGAPGPLAAAPGSVTGTTAGAVVTPPAVPATPGAAAPAPATPAGGSVAARGAPELDTVAAKPAVTPAKDRPPKAADTIRAPATSPRSREPAPPADAPIHFSTGAPKLNPDLATAYQLLQSGSLQGARDAYERALRADPRNLDALTGLATIAVREGQSDRAQALYAQALEADPKNAAALTGLIAMRGHGDPAQSESRLKTVLAGLSSDSPQFGIIQFALGNLYAGQRRWNDAQAAYFQAYTSDGNNPDYLFNLAVSLDHLQQNRLAAQFYQSALQAADSRAAGFDRVQARSRLGELKP